jgi:hypothetical protein
VLNIPLKNGDLLRQRINPERLCMLNTLRALDFFAFVHITIFERSVNFEFFEQPVKEADTVFSGNHHEDS